MHAAGACKGSESASRHSTSGLLQTASPPPSVAHINCIQVDTKLWIRIAAQRLQQPLINCMNCCSGEVETAQATVDVTVTAAEPTSSADEEPAAEVASHPLPDMFGAQVGVRCAIANRCPMSDYGTPSLTLCYLPSWSGQGANFPLH